MSSPVLIPQSPCLSIHEFFQKSYAVPDFQRGYAWKTEQVSLLLDDIHEFLDTNSPVYLLGQVIVAYSKGPEDYILVDGQQRTSTLLLMLVALHKRFMMIQNLHQNQMWFFMANNLYSLIVYATRMGDLRPRVTVASDGPDLVNALIRGSSIPEIKGWTRENIKEAYDVIYEYLERHWPDVNETPELYNKLVSRIFLVRLELPNTELAVDVFERINDRGMGLSSADLIKNTIFQKVNESDYLKQISVNWDKTSNILYTCKTSRIRNVEYLLRSLILIKKGSLITNQAMIKVWRDELSDEITSKEFAKNLPKYAENLRSLDLNLTPKGLATNVGQGCKYFVTVQHFPLLLAASHLDKHSYEMIANVVEDRTILSLLARERSQEFEKIIPEWGKKISELPHNCTIQDIMEASKNALANSKEIIDAAKLKVRELRASNTTQRNRIRYILARISRKIQFNAAVPGVPDLNVFYIRVLLREGRVI